ncbi:MAG: phosphoadenylyl-sulfate reductase [Betaproteobacteria bacterium]
MTASTTTSTTATATATTAVTTPGTRGADALALLHRAALRYPDVALASSFGVEDMILTDMIARHALPIRIFTLDTGRLPDETYALIDRVREHYSLAVEVYYPDHVALERHVREHGVNAFYRSVALRQACCAIRKSEPLARALAGTGAWITGQRRAQALSRSAVDVEEFDAERRIPKLNPLAEWSEDNVWDYVRSRDVPTNALHARGYPSIGCAPCTRAVAPGEDVRSGRWWWETAEHRECGIHRRPLIADRAATREVAA